MLCSEVSQWTIGPTTNTMKEEMLQCDYVNGRSSTVRTVLQYSCSGDGDRRTVRRSSQKVPGNELSMTATSWRRATKFQVQREFPVASIGGRQRLLHDVRRQSSMAFGSIVAPIVARHKTSKLYRAADLYINVHFFVFFVFLLLYIVCVLFTA